MKQTFLDCDKPNFRDDFPEISQTFSISGRYFHLVAFPEDINYVQRLLITNWFNVQKVVVDEEEFSQEYALDSRQIINKCLFALKKSLQHCVETKRSKRIEENVRNCFKHLEEVMLPFSGLEGKFLLKLAAVNSSNNKNCPLYNFLHVTFEIFYHLTMFDGIREIHENLIEKCMENLIILAYHVNKKSLNVKTLFSCNCVGDMWKFLLKTVEMNKFWIIFEKLIANFDPIFVLRLMREISQLTDCNLQPNFNLLENKMKEFLQNDNKSDTLLEMLRTVEPLLTNKWLNESRIEIYQNLWEFYTKRLNVSRKNYSTSTVNDFIEIFTLNTINDDFELFVSMLSKHLDCHPGHWSRFKGRVYSHMSPGKLKELNETGIARIVILFVGVFDLYHEEVVKRILPAFDIFFKGKTGGYVWTVFMAFLALQVKQCKTIEKSSLLIQKYLEEASSESSRYHLVTTFFDGFKHLITDQMDLGQHTLFGIWLEKYLNMCYYQDLVTAVDILANLLGKVENVEFWFTWREVFQKFIYPGLKKIVTKSKVPSKVGSIAGKLYVADQSLDVFNFFNSNNVNSTVLVEFNQTVLGSNKIELNNTQKILIIQSWVKTVLTSKSTSNFNKLVINLDLFPTNLKNYMLKSPDPLLAFIEFMAIDVKSHKKNQHSISLCDHIFGNINAWLSQYLNFSESQIDVYRIFTTISLCFLHCGNLIYDPNKMSSPLTKLMQTMIFPNEVLVGKMPHGFVLEAMRKTWIVFFEALTLLNSDVYLERSMKDLITKYVPYFNVEDNPMLNCFRNEKLCLIFLKKVRAAYFTLPIKESDANLLKIVRMLKIVIESTTNFNIFQLITNQLLNGMFEVIINHQQRSPVINLIKIITNSDLFAQIDDEFNKSIVFITEKCMGLNTVNYFQLMLTLCNFAPGNVKKCIEHIKSNVGNVERQRGTGFDQNLRLQLEKLERSLNECLNK